MTTQEELAAYEALLAKPNLSFTDVDIDALADGIIAHREGKEFHENPHKDRFFTVRRLCWAIGWNERALRNR